MLDQISNLILPTLEHFQALNYWIVFLAALLETIIAIGLFIPGSTIILLLGALSAKGIIDVGDLIFFAVLGAIIGDNINYYLGRKFGSKWTEDGIWFLKKKHFNKAKDYFNTYGAKSLFFGRFIPSIKETIPFIAGSVKMRRSTFFFWNIIGGIGWGFSWVMMGYIFAQSLNLALFWMTRASFLFIIIILVIFSFYTIKILIIKKGKKYLIFLKSLTTSILIAINNNREIIKFKNKHKFFYSFVKKRVDSKKFTGLSLTLLSLAFLYILIMLSGLIEDVVRLDSFTMADTRISNLFYIFRNEYFNNIFLWITMLGKLEVIIIFFIASSFILWIWKKQFYIIPFLVSIIGSEAFTYLGKIIFHRPRPELAYYLENSFSFPSGHATIAISFYGFVTYLLIKNLSSWKLKINSFFGGLIVILAIGFSRIYLGVHYLSDVWGGFLVGLLWLLIAISLSEWLANRQIKNVKIYIQKSIIFSSLIVFIALFCYVAISVYKIPQLKPALDSNIKNQIIVKDVFDIFSSEQSKFTETLIGDKQEPISFIIVAKDDQEFLNLFNKSNWELADKVSFESINKISKAIFFKNPYPNAPMTPSFWNSVVNTFGFEKETDTNSARQRHHVRFWKTNNITVNQRHIYVGTASLDSSVKWFVTHAISPDIDTEREYLFMDINSIDKITDFQKKQLVNPTLGKNFSGDQFFTDGEVYIIEL